MENNNMTDLLDNFKSILNNNTSNSSTSEKNTDSNSNRDINITPEIIDNLTSRLKNTYVSDTSNYNSDSEHKANPEDAINIDFETIIKIKNILESLNNQNDSRSNLLYSLKPYLRESKQKKIDQYISLFKISGIAKALKQEKGDLK